MQAYSNVALVSSSWVLLAYAQMPFGPTAAMTGRSPGQQKVSIDYLDSIFLGSNTIYLHIVSFVYLIPS